MKYRAFVASTRKDLEDARQHVIERLRKANLEVIEMEDWAADPEHPAIVSAANIAGCHFCVALIGFRRGTISDEDESKRSITQIEVDTARARGVRVLTFLLEDTPANRAACPREHNDLADRSFADWRKRLESSTTSEFFNFGEKPDVLPAVTRQITKWEQRRRRRIRNGLVATLAACVALVAALLVLERVRSWFACRLLAYNDPVLFSFSRDGSYHFARLLNGRSEIQDNTNFRAEIGLTSESFSIVANTFGSFRDYSTEFEQLVKRGARLRVVITDFWSGDNSVAVAFARAAEGTMHDSGELVANATNIRGMIRDLRRRFPDFVEIRLNRQPLLFTLWVRDPDRETALAHLGVHYYGQKSEWPAFRVSRTTGGNMLLSAARQFERVWEASTPDGPE